MAPQLAAGSSVETGKRLHVGLQLAAVCALYFASAKLGLAFASSNESVSAVWPPTGVALAAILVLGYRVWPAVTLGAFLANLGTDTPLITVAGISVGNTLEAVGGGFLLLRVARFRPALDRVRDVVALVVLGGGAATAISATIGVASLWIGNSVSQDDLATAWRTWWLGDACGALIIAPALMVYARLPRVRPVPRETAEAFVVSLMLVGVSVFVFDRGGPATYAVFPPLFWIALRFRQPGAVSGSLLLAAVAVWFTSEGRGPFVDGSQDTALLREQAFVAVSAVTALLIAVITTERHRLSSALNQLKRSETARGNAEARIQNAFDHAPIGVALVDPADRFIEVNDSLCGIAGHSRDELIGRTVESLVHPAERQRRRIRVKQLLSAETSRVSAEQRLIDKSGSTVWVEATTSVVRDSGGEPLYRILQVQDISERKLAEARLQYLADHDALTGLFNRRRLIEELDREAARNRRSGGNSAVLVVDLDRFKYVNDTLGHAVGDDLIARIGDAISRRFADGEIVSRLGGDEFAVLLPIVDEGEAVAHAKELLAAVREEAVVVSRRSMRVTASVGIALLKNSHRRRGEDLLAAADMAMYRAKQAGGDRHHLHEPTDSSEMRTRLTWSERVRDALEHDRFALEVQPILDISNGTIARHELLIRMVEGDELISPSAFLYIAEEFGMIQALDRWVIKRAIELVRAAEATGESLTLEINLSGHSITDDEVLEFIEGKLMTGSIDPSSLIFEVTETAAIRNFGKAQRFASRVSELGSAFALDDFGTGFGSFYYLKHLPFDYLKIDGDFIRELPESATDQLTVQAIVQIARGMGKRTIAEFVQSQDTLDLLRRYGVDFAQGFHIGRPVPVEERWPVLLGAVSR